MKDYILQAINGKMYIAANTVTTLKFRELPPEELVIFMLNANTEVYGGNNGMHMLAVLSDYDIAVR